jgi:hypothetical protein
MTTIARLQIYVQTSGDITFTQIANMTPSVNSIAEVQVRQIDPGDNELRISPTGIPPLAAAGYTLKGLLIVPEPTNTVKLTVKGSLTDIGIILNPTDPSFLAIDFTPELYINNPSAGAVYVKFVWI